MFFNCNYHCFGLVCAMSPLQSSGLHLSACADDKLISRIPFPRISHHHPIDRLQFKPIKVMISCRSRNFASESKNRLWHSREESEHLFDSE
jgi:hypothetical protein